MKKVFLSTLCIALLLNQSVRPEPSWLEKILNHKVALCLGIACIATNLAWGKLWYDQREEIDDLETEKKIAETKLKNLEKACKKVQEDNKTLTIFKELSEQYSLFGASSTGALLVDYEQHKSLPPYIKKEFGKDLYWDAIKDGWDSLDPRELYEPSDVTVNERTVIERTTTVTRNNKYKTIYNQNMADLLTQAKKPNDDDKISRSKQLASEARQKHSVFKKKQASGKENR